MATDSLTAASSSDTGLVQTPPARMPLWLRRAGWITLAIVCLVGFTVLKLPEDRVRNYVNGEIAAQLAPRGIGFNAAEGRIAIGFGISYVMKDITLTFPAPEPSAQIDKIIFSPSILPLLLGRQGGKLWIYNKDGSVVASFWMKGSMVSADLEASKLDIGRLGVLPLAAGFRGSAIVNGTANFKGDLEALSTITGESKLTLSRIVIDQQTLYGFAVPRINVSEGTVDAIADKGKVTMRKVQLGKPGNTADDIQASINGDISLGKTVAASTINARTRLTLSEQVLKSFILIDALLGPGKQPDGSYAFNLTGSLAMPNSTPASGG